MKKNCLKPIFIAALLLLGLEGFGQVSILVTPPAFQFSFKDLWNVQILSPGNSNSTYRLYVNLRNGNGDGFSIRSKEFQIPAGGLILSPGNFAPIQPFEYQYYGSGFSYYTLQQAEYFPAGNYHVNYSLFRTSGTVLNEPLDEASFEIEIPDFTDLFLTSPYDGDTIEELLPLFTWVYSSIQPTAGCTYELALVKMQQGQSKWEAVNSNPLQLSKTGVPFTLYQYAVSDRPLEEGSTYAWYVKALCSGVERARSQVWQFTVAQPEYETEEPEAPNYYHDLVKGYKIPSINVKDNFLKIRYITRVEDKDGLLNYSIIDSKGAVVSGSDVLPLQVQLGENRYSIDLCPIEGIGLKKGQYVFVVHDEQGGTWRINFEHEKKEACK